MEHKITLLKHTNLKGFSAYETTSFLRGDLFVLIDDILTRAYNANVFNNISCRILKKSYNI